MINLLLQLINKINSLGVSVMLETVVSKPIYKILNELTGENRIEIAMYLAIKELVTLKLEHAILTQKTFEQKYKMDFNEFEQAWNIGKIKDKYLYTVEKDYWEWEASITDKQRLEEILKWLP